MGGDLPTHGTRCHRPEPFFTKTGRFLYPVPNGDTGTVGLPTKTEGMEHFSPSEKDGGFVDFPLICPRF